MNIRKGSRESMIQLNPTLEKQALSGAKSRLMCFEYILPQPVDNGLIILPPSAFQPKPDELKSRSSLDRVSANRMMMFLKREIRELLLCYLFEPNDRLTRVEILNSVNQFLQSVLIQRGLVDYSVICDETNNPPSAVDNHELRVDVLVKLLRAKEFFFIPFKLLPTNVKKDNDEPIL